MAVFGVAVLQCRVTGVANWNTNLTAAIIHDISNTCVCSAVVNKKKKKNGLYGGLSFTTAAQQMAFVCGWDQNESECREKREIPLILFSGPNWLELE